MINKFTLASKLKNSKAIDKESFIEEKCRDKTVLDLGCIRHSADYALKDQNWLHKKIKAVAKKVSGVDYLPEEIEKLSRRGYDIIFGDVTKPLKIEDKFDVIVAGDLIEHLSNFEGFFTNCRNLLKPYGILIITTPNPFYSGFFHYIALKRSYLANPEHTCSIDPQCLLQLCERFGFVIDEIYFIHKSWEPGSLICENENHVYDILNGKWTNDTISFRILRIAMAKVFNVFYPPYKLLTGANTILVRYSDYIATFTKQDG
jgi:SAM-dependent methyltransferase